MACFHPLRGWRSREVNENGKRPIVFNRKNGFTDMPVELACGRCLGCRLEKSRMWAVRCLHESTLHDQNCFLTLTYNDENLPENGSLVLEHFQLFMKKLRKKYEKIRYFHCGEYGEDENRPHYHVILFNLDFNDKIIHKIDNGNRIYTSETLENIWSHGYCYIGSVTFQSAAYVARYILKKVTGPLAADHYNGRKPEYITMSRRPGIGRAWLDKYKTDVYPMDYIIVNGKKLSVPRFYDETLTEEELLKIKSKRKKKAIVHADNNTFRRLQDRETVQIKRADLLTRN